MSVDRKYERDIDLLLAEELMVDETFAYWFAVTVGLADVAGLVDVWVSKSDNLGESDLIALYDCTDGSRTALMVEDKVDAPMQPDQAGRYRLRGQREVAAGLCSRYRVVLCAPSAYLRGSVTVSDSMRAFRLNRSPRFCGRRGLQTGKSIARGFWNQRRPDASIIGNAKSMRKRKLSGPPPMKWRAGSSRFGDEAAQGHEGLVLDRVSSARHANPAQTRLCLRQG